MKTDTFSCSFKCLIAAQVFDLLDCLAEHFGKSHSFRKYLAQSYVAAGILGTNFLVDGFN